MLLAVASLSPYAAVRLRVALDGGKPFVVKEAVQALLCGVLRNINAPLGRAIVLRDDQDGSAPAYERHRQVLVQVCPARLLDEPLQLRVSIQLSPRAGLDDPVARHEHEQRHQHSSNLSSSLAVKKNVVRST